MTKVFKFNEQLERGKYFESVIDDHLSSMGMTLEEVPIELERLGIDRIVTGSSNVRMTVEIKADERGQDTGNAFIETVSIERRGVVEKLGWIYTSCAQVLIYYLPLKGEVIFVDMPLLKRRFNEEYRDRYRSVAIENPTYTGHGVVVPLTRLREDAFSIDKIAVERYS